jgi:hypothetical protein
MRPTIFAVVAVAALSCSDDAGRNGDGGAAADMAAPTVPALPTLGAEIDRMGRAAINTALTDPFDLVSGQTPDQVKDAYNAESDPTKWVSKFAGPIGANLALLDGLDGECGNQIGAALSNDAGTRYATLASTLADDAIYLDTTQTTCAQYLAVEAGALLGLGLKDCGGRTPTMDVIDVTLTALIVGAAGLTAPSMAVTDGVSQPDPKPTNTMFPFLAAPL